MAAGFLCVLISLLSPAILVSGERNVIYIYYNVLYDNLPLTATEQIRRRRSSPTFRGFILKAPRVLTQNYANSIYLSLYDVNSPGNVTVKLLTEKESVVAETNKRLNGGESDVVMDLVVPSVGSYEGVLVVEGVFDTEDNYTIFGQDTVTFVTVPSRFIFVQTDKPLYKPGQEVKFRVLVLDEKLKAVTDLNGSVRVEDPDGSVIAQWKNVSFQNGFVQLQLPLSEEPKLGTYSIFASVNDTQEVTTFEVKEYVLPKFEVIITPPPYVLVTTEEIPIKICAKYTYGKKVEGTLKLNASLEIYAWSRDKFPVLQEEVQLDGCYEYSLNVSLIDEDLRNYYRRIQIFAEVTEKGTDITRNETKFIDRTHYPVQLSFQSDSPEFFKPGLPYHGKVKVTYPDGSPGKDEPVRMCASVSRERIISGWSAKRTVKICRNFTSDDKGIINFTVPPQNTDVVSLNLEARSMKYTKQTRSPRPTLYVPESSYYLRPWYSPSGSHMQIQDIKGDIPCGTKKDVQILFTAKENGDYTFFYELYEQHPYVPISEWLYLQESFENEYSKPMKFGRRIDEHYQFAKNGRHLSSILGIISGGDKMALNTNKGSSISNSKKVVSDEKVIEKNSVTAHFDEKDAVPVDNFENVIDGDEISINPALDNDDGNKQENVEEDMKCKSLAETRYVPHIGTVNISVDVTPALSPSFYVVVYYVRKDRETVADSQRFSVEKCFPNKVSLQFGDESKQPGTKTTLSVSATPNSICGIKVVDKSVSLLDSNDPLSKEKVFDTINRYSFGRHYSRNHCNEPQPGLNKQDRKAGSVIIDFPPVVPSSSSSYEDALTAFETAGFLVISDLTLLTRPCKRNKDRYGPVHAQASEFDGGKKVFRAPPAPSPPRALALARVSPAMAGGFGGASADALTTPTGTQSSFDVVKSVVDVRTFFPETWLFDIELVGEEGQLVVKKTLPHTITEWLGSAFCINKEEGFGVSDVAGVKGFQAFFTSFTLPYSVIRGEKLPVVVSVFNYLDKCLPITLELSESDNFKLLSESSKTDICVCGGKSESHRFYIQPTSLGTLNLTVSGKTADSPEVCGSNQVADAVARDAVTNPLIVEAEGFPFENVTTFLFCPKDYPDGVFKESIPYILPDDLVEDSGRGYISITGDIMGPAIQGVDRLVQMPTGCGEQNIVLFAPNVYVLDYLNAIGQISDKIKQQATKNLQTGYQRELKYKRRDSSYSAFGNVDKEGSMFLTAFVLRSFADAARYIDIDPKDLESSRSWILSQQMKDGCFPEVGTVFSHSLKGGMQNSSSSLMTAYVLSSLLSSGMDMKNVSELAMACIDRDDQLTPYKAALFAYTSSLAGNQEKAEKYLEELYKKAENDGDKVYWQDKYMSVQVEIASYAVLTNMMLGKSLEKSLPIVKWMNKNRNSRGGFSSTQDTVLGLEALSKFAPLISKNPVDIKIALTGSLDEKLSITDDDKLLLRKYKLSSVPGELNVEASGSGCGMIQATLRCNTKTPHNKGYFNIDIKTEKVSESSCKNVKIDVCTNYLPEAKKSNMALIEMKMVSGFVPVKESLEKLQYDKAVELKRFEVDNNNVVLYFEELTNDKKCFSFLVERVAEVDEMKPATAKVYDYYATESSFGFASRQWNAEPNFEEKQQETSYEITGC